MRFEAPWLAGHQDGATGCDELHIAGRGAVGRRLDAAGKPVVVVAVQRWVAGTRAGFAETRAGFAGTSAGCAEALRRRRTRGSTAPNPCWGRLRGALLCALAQ